MSKKKLLMVVGAGASVDFGVPSVAKVSEVIGAAIQKIYPLANDRTSNLYAYIEGRIGSYWKMAIPAALHRAPHYEDVLYAIFALVSAYPAAAHTSALGALIAPQVLPDVLEFGRSSKHVGRGELNQLAAHAVDAVADEFRRVCQAVATSKVAEFSRLLKLTSALQAEFDVAVVTLNYDNIVYRALAGIETGFDPVSGEFRAERILDRLGWPCMLHLHGSVHFDMPGPRAGSRDLHEIRWQANLGATFAGNAAGRNIHASPEGADFPTSVLVAGYGKTIQILRLPFRTYYSEVDQLVSQCDALLFAGYGFGDEHLNGAFKRFRDVRRRPVVILGYAPKGTMTLGGFDPDRLAHGVVHVLETDRHSMTWLGYKHPDVVDALLDAREFEVSSNSETPLSVWYNGMLEACDNAAKVVAKLM